MKHLLLTSFLAGILLLSTVVKAQTMQPDSRAFSTWIQEMKKSPRGPFKRIRWFCNDGTIQPPKPYACSERGGGVQHGEWTDRTKTLRANGYYIANVLADMNAEDFLHQEEREEILKQILLEQFLMHYDDGWIFHRARYYRGSLQAEDEARSGRNLLHALAKEPDWRNTRFNLLREAVRLLPHGKKGSPIIEVRQLSRLIAEEDEGFGFLRTKIHVKPDADDAERVRTYARSKGVSGLLSEYERLAIAIEKVYRPQEIGTKIAKLAGQLRDSRLALTLRENAVALSGQRDPLDCLKTASQLLTVLRDNLSIAGSSKRMLAFLDASLALEQEVFRCGNELIGSLVETSRRKRLVWLKNSAFALYGIGMISKRQWFALQESLARLTKEPPSLITYKAELDYLSRVPEWAERMLRFHFSEEVAFLSKIEPLVRQYFHDRLHSSPLLLYAAVLDSLIEDANSLLGIHHTIFGETVAGGLRGLNPGLARGNLMFFHQGEENVKWDRNGIYVLPVTTPDLPPVAGIVTKGKGNSLSHVQLLARNLGIPNVSVNKRLLTHIRKKEGLPVVFAVSPRGVVHFVEDGPEWDTVFQREGRQSELLIRPEVGKLNLDNRDFVLLSRLAASDSGRIAGPKAANLGELKNHFPEAVPDGLVIPFGIFRALFDQPIDLGGPSMFQWMKEQYKSIQSMKGESQKRELATRRFLKQVRNWIINTDPGIDFRKQLRSALSETFGMDENYGVFVRSDTNVEDLPGFTGAGLNLTVPNVVGFENIIKAISSVWASPYTERAYGWRQAHMEKPEHVYVSVLLMKSIPVEKSGVMVTADLESGLQQWLSIAVNEGVGGAVKDQAAEELRVHIEDGTVRLLAQATEPKQKIVLSEGGVAEVPVSGTDRILKRKDIHSLIKLARTLPIRFPVQYDAQGRLVPFDAEFGFYKDRLVLFQIRPFLESSRAQRSLFLNSLDRELNKIHFSTVNLDKIP